jgi:hypothetical protein
MLDAILRKDRVETDEAKVTKSKVETEHETFDVRDEDSDINDPNRAN